jgi:hypothetical protein
MNSFDSSLILELISFLFIEIKLQVESNFRTIFYRATGTFFISKELSLLAYDYENEVTELDDS